MKTPVFALQRSIERMKKLCRWSTVPPSAFSTFSDVRSTLFRFFGHSFLLTMETPLSKSGNRHLVV